MKLQYLGSYTSLLGHQCYKWIVVDGAGPLAVKPFSLLDRKVKVLYPGDVVQCRAKEFWAGWRAPFVKGTNTHVDRAAVRR